MKKWSYTFTPPMGRKACTEPQSLYMGALYLYITFNIRSTITLYLFVSYGSQKKKVNISLL